MIAFGQRIASTMYTALNQYHGVLEVDPRFQSSPDSFNNIYVSSSAGQQVPLSAVTNSAINAAPLWSTIRACFRRPPFRSIWLSQLLTLFTTPVVYIYLDRLQDLLRQWRGSVQ